MGIPIYCERLRVLREDSKYSQEEIAKIVGTSQSYYAQYENGKRPIPLERIMKLAKFYGVTLDWLVGFTTKPKQNGNPFGEVMVTLLLSFRPRSINKVYNERKVFVMTNEQKRIISKMKTRIEKIMALGEELYNLEFELGETQGFSCEDEFGYGYGVSYDDNFDIRAGANNYRHMLDKWVKEHT